MTATPELNSKANKKGLHTIFLRITHNRKMKRIAIGFGVKMEEWNPEKKEVRKSNPLYAQINAAIKAKTIEAEQQILIAQVQSKPLTVRQLQNRLKKQIVGECFLAYTQKRVSNLPNPATRGNQQSTLNKFKRFLGRDELLFPELDYNIINDFLKNCAKRGNGQNTINKDYRNLRAAYREAQRDGTYETERDPWIRVVCPKEKTIRRRLSNEELQLVANYELKPNTVAYHSRAAFMLSFYLQGARVSDILQLKWSNIIGIRCEFIASKTGKLSSKKLPEQALPILQYFREHRHKPKPTDYILPFVKKDPKTTSPEEFRKHIESMNSQINTHLYELADKLQIPRFSMHTARHTFANIAIRASGGNVHVVSDALGHSSIQITEQYFDSAYKDENDELGDLVFKKSV
ncbi:MAG: hypothetical protein EAZ63_03825 [Runella slithyformis]|nr:MAG: hypothetical protein EAZ63_03825 [Runella slithyformis]